MERRRPFSLSPSCIKQKEVNTGCPKSTFLVTLSYVPNFSTFKGIKTIFLKNGKKIDNFSTTQSNKVTVLVNSTSATKLIWFAGKKNWVIWLAFNQAGFKSVCEWYSLAFLFSVYFYIWVFSSNESLFTCHWLSNLTSL